MQYPWLYQGFPVGSAQHLVTLNHVLAYWSSMGDARKTFKNCRIMPQLSKAKPRVSKPAFPRPPERVSLHHEQ
jgi:hypothetical protein